MLTKLWTIFWLIFYWFLLEVNPLKTLIVVFLLRRESKNHIFPCFLQVSFFYRFWEPTWPSKSFKNPGFEGQVGLSWANLGTCCLILGLCWAILELCWTILELCWAILQPSWSQVEHTWQKYRKYRKSVASWSSPPWAQNKRRRRVFWWQRFS